MVRRRYSAARPTPFDTGLLFEYVSILNDSRSALLLAASLLPAACGIDRPLLEQVQHSGMLRVLTLNSSTTYYVGPYGVAGLEHDLVQLFADFLGVQVEFTLVDSASQALTALATGDAHLAAAGLAVTHRRERRFRFGPPVQTVTQQVVYRRGSRRPRDVSELVGRELEVVAESSHAERLRELETSHPDLSWHESSDTTSEELLDLVHERVIELTISDSNLVALNRRLNPELGVAFDISPPQALAWAFRKSADRSLFEAASEFLRRLTEDGTLDVLVDRYYGHTQRFDYVDTRAFRRNLALRFPAYRDIFERAARAHGLDWRLLSAMGYQESHWDPEAVSPTGVRGIMMLTEVTAGQLGVQDRTDPEQSIFGGAAYLSSIRKRIPEHVSEPDRTWLALAAYNVGYGHLLDALELTKLRGGNPGRWVDVRQTLPLLAQKKWYAQTRYGYARGKEPVRYVDSVRRYRDLLATLDGPNQPPRKLPALSISARAL